MPGTELLEALQECGAALPESHKPAVTATPELMAGLLYYLETGSTVPPEPAPEARAQNPQDIEIERLKSELASAQAKQSPTSFPASPVAPAPPEPAAPAPASAPGESPTVAAGEVPSAVAGEPPAAEPTPTPAVPEPPAAPPVSEVPSEPTR